MTTVDDSAKAQAAELSAPPPSALRAWVIRNLWNLLAGVGISFWSIVGADYYLS